MMDLDGSIRPAMYLADSLVASGHTVSMISPAMSSNVEHHLSVRGIRPVNLHARLFTRRLGLSLLWFETWSREAFFRLNSRHLNRDCRATINFSHTLAIPSLFWYLQGPTSAALKDMENQLASTYKSVYLALKGVINYTDGRLIRDIGHESTIAVANSKFCASLYREWGIEAAEIVYPPIDCKLFRPQASNPSGDFVLTYFGKETKFSVVKAVADLGVKIKAFGSKAPFVPKSVTGHPNIDFRGRIPVDELVDLYSNALFILFPFNHEPFGYIPVESMACGTPTLTYCAQGPSESVVDGYSGWLAKDDEEIVSKAVKLWKQGYELGVRANCVREAAKFDKDVYAKRWSGILRKSLQ
jgi:glycosyltransferase involved in cell wall biosynthesis